jgi:hypothetical protein
LFELCYNFISKPMRPPVSFTNSFLRLVTQCSHLCGLSLILLSGKGICASGAEDAASPEVTPAVAKSGKKEVPLVQLPESYVDFYKLILSSPESRKRPGFQTDAALASVALRLWERTHDESYRKIAVEEFAKTLSDPKFSLADFHILHHFGELIWRMKRDGLLTPEQQKQLVGISKEELIKYLKQPDDTLQPIGAPLYNIRIAQILGYAGLLKFLEGEPFDQRQEVETRLNNYFNLLVNLGNPDEDAENYDSLGLAFAVDLARLLGREKEFKTPGFQRYFENCRDIVTPSGILPEYGDSYFSYEDLPMDRVFLMESAARLYNDPTYLAALQKMRARPQRGLPDADHWIRSLSLIDMPDSAMKSQPITNQPSQVLLRNTAASNAIAAVPDKLILRTGRESGDSMVMMDLYASGSHAHRDKGPSIAYFESAQAPLFHNMGRHGSRSAINGNICWALPPEERFPGFWQPGQWFTMNYPTDLITTNSDGKCVLSKMSLRNFPERNRGCTSLAFDNLRLSGASGNLLVDGFDSPDGWSKSLAKFAAPTSSPDKTEGQAAQYIPWNQIKTTGIERDFSKPLPAPFSTEQYTALKIDLKYEGVRPYMLVRGIGAELELGAHELRPQLTGATVEQRGRDALGQVNYAHYITGDTTLVRRIVLTAEGYLIIRDTLTPGSSMNGWNAGQLWQLYTMAAHGDDWFCSEDEGAYPNVTKDSAMGTTQRMFVRFVSDTNTSVGFEEMKQPIVDPNPKGRIATSFFTTFSKRKVTAGHPEVFGFVVIPNDPKSTTPDELAKKISVSLLPDGSVEATTSIGTNPITVHLAEKEWSVKR